MPRSSYRTFIGSSLLLHRLTLLTNPRFSVTLFCASGLTACRPRIRVRLLFLLLVAVFYLSRCHASYIVSICAGFIPALVRRCPCPSPPLLTVGSSFHSHGLLGSSHASWCTPQITPTLATFRTLPYGWHYYLPFLDFSIRSAADPLPRGSLPLVFQPWSSLGARHPVVRHSAVVAGPTSLFSIGHYSLIFGSAVLPLLVTGFSARTLWLVFSVTDRCSYVLRSLPLPTQPAAPYRPSWSLFRPVVHADSFWGCIRHLLSCSCRTYLHFPPLHICRHRSYCPFTHTRRLFLFLPPAGLISERFCSCSSPFHHGCGLLTSRQYAFFATAPYGFQCWWASSYRGSHWLCGSCAHFTPLAGRPGFCVVT